MKSLSIVASILACVAAVAHAQGPEKPCTFTETLCTPLGGTTRTITVYEQPFATTTTRSWDCSGCADVTVSSKACFGVGPPVTTTTFDYVNARTTVTVDVCSPTPTA